MTESEPDYPPDAFDRDRSGGFVLNADFLHINDYWAGKARPRHRYTSNGEHVRFSAADLVDQVLLAANAIGWINPGDAPKPWPRVGQLGLPWPGVDKPWPSEPQLLFCVRDAMQHWATPMERHLVAVITLQAIGLGAIMESEGIPEHIKRAMSAAASKAAQARHAENHDMKAQALAWYAEHKDEYPSKYEAATAIAEKVVPASFATVRKWLREKKRT